MMFDVSFRWGQAGTDQAVVEGECSSTVVEERPSMGDLEEMVVGEHL